MVYPPIVDYKALGVKDKLLNIYEDLGYVENQILVGLGVNKNLVLGDGPSFGNVKTMALHRLIMEYQTIRDMFERWIYNKVFRRIAEENKFYVFKGKIKKLIYPKIEWERSLSIEDEENERKILTDMHGKGFISTKTLYGKFPNIDFETEKKNLEEERGTIFDKTDGKRIPKEVKKEESNASPAAPSTAPSQETASVPNRPESVPPAPEGLAGLFESSGIGENVEQEMSSTNE